MDKRKSMDNQWIIHGIFGDSMDNQWIMGITVNSPALGILQGKL